jgi:phosphopantothenoylcysteine decarboxylase/phosphopantothenate--cysteine ligase
MHEAMWLHPATQANVKTLKRFGYQFIGPERGSLGRVGDQGVGRMSEPEAIASAVLKSLGKSSAK